jgi:hypothetical protein
MDCSLQLANSNAKTLKMRIVLIFFMLFVVLWVGKIPAPIWENFKENQNLAVFFYPGTIMNKH